MASLISISSPSELELNFIKDNLAYTHKHSIEFSQTGVGGLHTLFHLCSSSSRHVDYAIQAGIAGALGEKVAIGQAVIVESEAWGDLGVWEQSEFRSIFEMGFCDENVFPYTQGKLFNPHAKHMSQLTQIPLVASTSVNQITTLSTHIAYLSSKGFDIENMEGGAFHYFCLQNSVPFIQLRAVSNQVGERDKSKWKITEALQSLVKSLNVLLGTIA